MKDRFCLSDESYLELSQLTQDLPRLYKLKTVLKRLDSKTTITSTPGRNLGVQQSLKQRLTIEVQHLLKNGRHLNLVDNCIHIKLSGEGTRVGRNLHKFHLHSGG